jgi:hypothetical protein
MPVLVTGIHAEKSPESLRKNHHVPTWMAGTSPAMTVRAVGNPRTLLN